MTITQKPVTESSEKSATTAVVAPKPASSGLRSRVSATSTPRLLSRLRLLCIVSLFLFGVSASLAIREAQSAAATANQTAEQYNRVYDIGAHVMAAHAAATHDLAAGTTISDSYRKEMTQAYQQITAAAVAVSQDRDQLAILTEHLQSYDDAMGKAAVARAGADQSATTQADAAQSITATKILPTINRIADRNRDQISSKSTIWLLTWLWLTGILSLLCLVGVGIILALRTHRVLNLGVLGAVLFVVLTLAIGQLSIGATSARIATTRTSSLEQLESAAHARIAVFSARSLEGLDLLSRSQAHEDKIQQTLATARNDLAKLTVPHEATTALDAVVASHEQVRSAVVAKNYSGALSSNGDAAATTFGQTLRGVSERLCAASVAANSKNVVLNFGALAAAVSCLSAIIMCNIGISRRLGDYR